VVAARDHRDARDVDAVRAAGGGCGEAVAQRLQHLRGGLEEAAGA